MTLQLTTKKKIIIATFSAFVLLGAGFVLLSPKTPVGKLTFEKNKKTAAEKSFEAIVVKDSDTDGLKDWEEALWKTDPNNPDSDGDGTPDGEEVRAGRDPAKPGPDDKINTAINKKKGPPANSLNATDKLARDLFSNFVVLYESGNLNDKNKKILLDTLTKKSLVKIKRSKYTALDMQTVPNNNKTLQNYSVALGNILSKKEGGGNEFMILQKALKENSEKELDKLKALADKYNEIANELLKIKVPEDLANENTALVNSLNNIAEDVRGISMVFKDPVMALAGINKYAEDEQVLIKTGENLGIYFKNKELTF